MELLFPSLRIRAPYLNIYTSLRERISLDIKYCEILADTFNQKPTKGEEIEAQLHRPYFLPGQLATSSPMVSSCHCAAPVCWSLHFQIVKFCLWVCFQPKLKGVLGHWHRAQVQWDAGTHLRCAISLSCPWSAPAPHQHLSQFLGGTGKAAGEHREYLCGSNVPPSVQPFTEPHSGLLRLQVCSPKAN